MPSNPPRHVLRLSGEHLPDDAPRALVLDTNIVLDLLVFADKAIAPVRTLLQARRLDWIATQPMRQELARVLEYPHIAARLAFYGLHAPQIMEHYAAQVRWVPVAARITAICKDADDQGFIDLAVAHRAILLSKDKAVLCMRKRLAPSGADIATAAEWPPAPALVSPLGCASV